MNKITERWKTTGLLDEMQEKDLDNMAIILETIAHELIRTCPPDNTPERNEHEQFCGMILPMARRVFDELHGENFPKATWLMEDYKNFYNTKKDLIEELNSYIALDGEAEFCSLYCKDVVERIRKNIKA